MAANARECDERNKMLKEVRICHNIVLNTFLFMKTLFLCNFARPYRQENKDIANNF